MALRLQRDNKKTSPRKHAELRALVWVGVAALVALALIFYDPANNPLLTTDANASGHNYTGMAGAACGFDCAGCVGSVSWGGGPLSAVAGALPGLLACGNALHVHDLADWASLEGRPSPFPQDGSSSAQRSE